MRTLAFPLLTAAFGEWLSHKKPAKDERMATASEERLTTAAVWPVARKRAIMEKKL